MLSPLPPQFDLEGFGEIPWPDFRNALVHPEFVAAVDLHKREQLAAKSLTPSTTAITFQDFVNVVSTASNFSFLFGDGVNIIFCSSFVLYVVFGLSLKLYYFSCIYVSWDYLLTYTATDLSGWKSV